MGIYYVDEIMGRGKTSAMINHINSAGPEQRFLVIVPYLTEVDRILDACTEREFVTPFEKGGKLRSIKRLIAEGRNIVSTHALFSMFDYEVVRLLRRSPYTLVLDEVPMAISVYPISHYDIVSVLKFGLAKYESDGRLVWLKPDYNGAFSKYMTSIKTGGLYHFNDWLWIQTMSRDVFTAFRDVYILTYLFNDQIQRCYFDMMHLPYRRKYVAGDSPETYRFSDTYEPPKIEDFRPLIHILDSKRMNQIGSRRGSLSKTWYIKHSERSGESEEITALRNNVTNFFINITKTKSSCNLWTTFCEDDEVHINWRKQLAAGGYSKGFLSCNARGTNEFRHKTALAYLINVYPNTGVMQFLARRGIHINQDRYALSEMVQWIWRSAIRDGKEIQLYIPSKRMRTLLINWMDEVCGGKGG